MWCIRMQGAAAGGGGAGGGSPTPAAQGPSAQPFNMFSPGGGGGGSGAGGEGGAGPLDFLRERPEFQLLRRAVRSNPAILVPMLQVGSLSQGVRIPN